MSPDSKLSAFSASSQLRYDSPFRIACGFFFLRFYLFFREKGREGVREGQKHQCTRETSIGCLSHTLNGGPGS